MQRVTKSLKISPDVWKEAKKHCIDEDIQLSEYIEALVKANLNIE